MSNATKSSASLFFNAGPDYFFISSCISHANLGRCWLRLSKISSSTVVDLCFFCFWLPLQVTEIFLANSVIKNNLIMIYWL